MPNVKVMSCRVWFYAASFLFALWIAAFGYQLDTMALYTLFFLVPISFIGLARSCNRKNGK